MIQFRPAVDLGARLRAAETLLDQALTDLTIGEKQTLGTQCGAALAQAEMELRAVAAVCTASLPALEERATLRQQIGGLVPRLQRLERLFAKASAFYGEWCAVAPASPSGYESAGYVTAEWCDRPRAALLAFEA